MSIEKYVLNKFKTSKMYNVAETTEILQQYGLSQNDKKTRELIRSKRLAAKKPEGSHADDRRSGYVISEKAIYDYVCGSIPIMAQIFDELTTNKPKGTKAKPVKKTTKKGEIEQSEMKLTE